MLRKIHVYTSKSNHPWIRGCFLFWLLTISGLLVCARQASGAPPQLENKIQSVPPSAGLPFKRGIGYWPIDYSRSFQERVFKRLLEGAEIAYVQFDDWHRPVEQKAKNDALHRWLDRAGQAGLLKYVAIEPFNGDRSQVRVPPKWKRSVDSVSDPQWREAYRQFVLQVVRHHKPHYLNIAVEANMYYRNRPDDYDSFRRLFNSLYQEIKRVSLETKVFSSYQYEYLIGQFGSQPTKTQWELLGAKALTQDMLGISTYPLFLKSRYDAQTIPTNYFQPLKEKTNLPIFVAEIGFYSSTQVQPISSPENQTKFIRRLPELFQGMNVEALCWISLYDLPDIPALAPLKKVFPHFFSLGLLDDRLSEKGAWQAWKFMAPPGASAERPPEVQKIADVRQDQFPLEGFMGLGSSETVQLSQRPDPETGSRALSWRYAFSTSPLPMIVKLSPAISESYAGLLLKLRSQKDASLAIILEESGGARYEVRRVLKAKTPQSHRIRWEDFTLQKGTRDSNQRLDLAQISKFILLDISAFMGKRGKNTIAIHEIKYLR